MSVQEVHAAPWHSLWYQVWKMMPATEPGICAQALGNHAPESPNTLTHTDMFAKIHIAGALGRQRVQSKHVQR